MNIALDGTTTFGDTPDSLAGGEVDTLTVVVTSQPTHGTVSFDAATGEFIYTPTDPGYVGGDSFTYSVSDGQQGADPAVGTVSLTLTNMGPQTVIDTSTTDQGVPITINVLGNDSDIPDTTPGIVVSGLEDLPLNIVSVGNAVGGKAVLNSDGTVTFTPDSDFVGTGSFTYYIHDGEQDYSGETPVPVLVRGVAEILVISEPDPFVPAAPLPLYEYPVIEGCPVLMEAAALELGITGETIQVRIGNALALNPNIQACHACAILVDASRILRDEDGLRMAAMVQVFNELAPADEPFTPAMAASIAMAFESAAEGSQYASVMEYIDAFAQYVDVLDTELGSPVGDSVAYVMEKHGAGVKDNENANIAAYVAMRLEDIGG